MRTLSTIAAEGFTCEIVEQDDLSVLFTADADIDADGANGQFGKRAAYMVGDVGSEALANGGMGMRGGRVSGVAHWFTDIVILDGFGNPREFGAVIASKTAYRFPGFALDDPAAYVDSETIPYAVVPPVIIQRTAGAVLGCRVVITYLKTGIQVIAVVADVGPRTRVGEISIEAARRAGMNPSPRNGGEESNDVRYQIYPGVPAVVDGRTFQLQTSRGLYLPLAA